MTYRLTVITAALCALAVSPVFADGAGCDYSTKYRYTSAEPQEPTAAEDKLASLTAPAGETTTQTTEAPSQPATAQ